jgi:integrase
MSVDHHMPTSSSGGPRRPTAARGHLRLRVPESHGSAAGARNFWAEEIKELAEKADIADFKPHDLRRWAMRGSE